MVASDLASSGSIFISYRREDSAYPAGWLFDRLADHFGPDRVFKDIDSIQLGDDFPEKIRAAVASCAVLLAMIGERWLTAAGEDGKRRLHNPNDYVRLEIEAALLRNILVIPVLINGTRMPSAPQLPASLHKLSDRHALELSPDRFHSDIRHLVTTLDRVLIGNQDGILPEDHHEAGAKKPMSERGEKASANLPLPQPPPWLRESSRDRTLAYQATPEVEQTTDVAIRLRKPLLVIGGPGSGKSSLAYGVAEKYGLGSVLRWRLRKRSTLREGLYYYDQAGRSEAARLLSVDERLDNPARTIPDIGVFVRLGPLGTALLPGTEPRVLLVEDLDRSDEDLPYDLLDVLEEGEFEIPELASLHELRTVVRTYDSDERAVIDRGRIRCNKTPVVIITSTGERDFPPAFLRRCVRLHLPPPDAETIARIVAAQLGPEALEKAWPFIDDFLRRRQYGELTVEQLLNAIYLSKSGNLSSSEDMERLAATLFPYIEGQYESE
jgi:MoxR-like ATPase